MKLSPVYAIAAVGVIVAVGTCTSAGAASKPKPAKVKTYCNIVTDPAGDATGFVVTGILPVSEPGLDILSADLATNDKLLTAVIRVKDLSSSSTAPTGRAYYLNFTVGGAQFYIDATSALTGSSAGLGQFSGAGGTRGSISGTVTATFDTSKNEVRMTTDLANITAKAPVKKGAKFTAITALTQRAIAIPGVITITPTADTTAEGTDYPAGAPSCVKVGS